MSSANESKSVKSIILDTSPILNNTPSISSLLNKCETLYTVQSVVDEVKDKNARSRLEVTILPFLKIRTPKPDSVKFISQFAQKTGDFGVLSAPDLQILALAYELDCEQSGGDVRLPQYPGHRKSNGTSSSKSLDTPKQPSQPTSEVRSLSNSRNHGDPAVEDVSLSVPETVSSDVSKAHDNNEGLPKFEDLQLSALDPRIEPAVDSITPDITEITYSDSAEVDPDISGSDSDGWITPSNLKKQQFRDQNASTEPISDHRIMEVATITGDFAMQVIMPSLSFTMQYID